MQFAIEHLPEACPAAGGIEPVPPCPHSPEVTCSGGSAGLLACCVGTRPANGSLPGLPIHPDSDPRARHRSFAAAYSCGYSFGLAHAARTEFPFTPASAGTELPTQKEPPARYLRSA